MWEISWSVSSLVNGLALFCLNTSIAIVSTQLNGFNYCYLTLIIQFNINHLFAHSEVVTVLLFNTNYTIPYYSFVCTQLNGSEYCYVSLKIQLNTVHLFTHS